MNISNEQFLNFFSRYRQIHTDCLDNQANQRVFQQAVEFIEQHFEAEYINCAGIGSSNQETVTYHANDWNLASQLLADCLLNNRGNLEFDANKAEVKRVEIRSRINTRDLRSIYVVTGNSGIREKLANGSLTNHEWLSDLDLQRMLQLTDTQSQVHISLYNVSSVRSLLHFARQNHQAATQPYTIYLLLNVASSAISSGLHWIAASVTVNPIAKTVTYEVIDSSPLSSLKSTQYAATMQQAITFSDSSAKAFLPSEGWRVEPGQVIGQTQVDGYSCGYRALHNLFQDNRLIKNNPIALAYRNTKADSDALVRAFYSAQLGDYQQRIGQVPPIAAKLASKIPQDIKKTSSTRPTPPYQAKPSVVESLNTMNRFTRRLNLPSAEGVALSSLDYQEFFLGLQAKLAENRMRLAQLTLPCASVDALNEISTGLTSVATLGVDALSISVPEQIDPEQWIQALQQLLSGLTQSGVPVVSIEDSHAILQQPHWQLLADWIERSTISLTINLPQAYATTAMQRRIDNATSNHQQANNLRLLQGRKAENNPAAVEPRVKRTRTTTNPRSGLSIDVEMAQEQQVEVAVAVSVAKEAESAWEDVEQGSVVGLDWPELQQALLTNQLALKPGVLCLSDEALARNWHTWLGNVVTQNATGEPQVYPNPLLHTVSLAAAEQLLNFQHLFQDGLDLEHLPAGFVVVPDAARPGGFILHFTNTAVGAANRLAPRLVEKPSAEALSVALVDTLLTPLSAQHVLRKQWAKLSTGSLYSRAASEAFRRYLPQLLRFNEQHLSNIFKLCATADDLDAEKLSVFVTHHRAIAALFAEKTKAPSTTKLARHSFATHFNDTQFPALVAAANQVAQASSAISSHHLLRLVKQDSTLLDAIRRWAKELSFDARQLDALMRVYDQYGAAGIHQLFASWEVVDRAMLRHLHSTLFKSAASFVPMLNNPALNDAYQEVTGLSQNPAQYQWWLQLTQQHAAAVGYDDLPTLLAAFHEFSEKINEYGLTFYPKVAFKQIASLPTALSRILSIIEHCKPVDRETVWLRISELPLQADGAIRACIDEGKSKIPCSFVVPEMRLTPQHYSSRLGYQFNADAYYSIARKHHNHWFNPEPDSFDWRNIGSGYRYSNVFELWSFEDIRQKISVSCDKTLAESVSDFYSYLAQQPHRFPLAFYQKKAAKLEEAKLNDMSKMLLYALLAGGTCGELNQKICSDQSSAEQTFERIIASCCNLKLPILMKPWRSLILKITLISASAPASAYPLSVLEQYLSGTFHALQCQAYSATAAAQELEKNFEFFSLNTAPFAQAANSEFAEMLYKGMALYPSHAFSSGDEPLLYKHSRVVGVLQDDYPSLYQVISQFDLTNDTAMADLNSIINACLRARSDLKTWPMDDDYLDYAANLLLKGISLGFTDNDFYRLLGQGRGSPISDPLAQLDKIKPEDYAAYGSPLERLDNMLRDLLPQELNHGDDKSNPDTRISQRSQREAIRFLSQLHYKSYQKLASNLQNYLNTGLESPGVVLDVMSRSYYSSDSEFMRLYDSKISWRENGPKSDEASLGYALELLSHINRRGLNSTHLLGLLEEFANAEPSYRYPRDVERIRTLIESRFAAYFPPNFFARLRDAQTPENIHSLLIKQVNAETAALIESLLVRFNQAGESSQYPTLNTLLVDCIRPLTLGQQSKLLRRLQELLDEQTVNITEFIDFVASLQRRNSLQDFLFFMNKAQRASEQARRGLLTKTRCYLERVLPLLRDDEPRAIGSIALLNLSIEAILASDYAELETPLELVRADASAYQTLVSQLRKCQQQLQDSSKQTRIELDAIKMIIDNSLEAMPSAAKLKQLQLLLKLLERLRSAPKAVKKSTLASIASGNFSTIFYKNKTLAPPDSRLLPTLTAAIAELDNDVLARSQYPRVVSDLLSMIERVLAHYPGDAHAITAYLNHYLQRGYGAGSVIERTWNTMSQVTQQLLELDNVDIVRSLCSHFSHSEGDYSHHGLWRLFSSPLFTRGERDEKRFWLNLVTLLANNQRPCSLDELHQLMAHYQRDGLSLAQLQALYQSPPYPSIAELNRWRQACPSGVALSAHLQAEYARFDLEPFAREAANRFNLNAAYAQAAKFSGDMEYRNPDARLEALALETQTVRGLSTAELRDALAQSRSGQVTLSAERLIALVAELLYRSKAMQAEHDGNGNRIIGRSFEINTTQYLALHAMLTGGRHVTGEIATGEGKSRIMMLLVACQYARGQTVDFVSSDMSLVTRDYLSFQSFFTALGAKTQLITQHTPARCYAQHGINFSDTANLSLFRNKARSVGQGARVIHPDASRRALLLDEADRAYFDLADKRFNISALADPSIRNMPWVYELLVYFFSQDNPEIMRAYYADIDDCNRRFLAFAHSRLDAERMSRLASISQAQLEIWQESAVAALQMQYGADFVIESPLDAHTAQGPLVVSEAHLMIHGNEDRHSKWSAGVHQCLHAQLNRLKQHPERIASVDLREKLENCAHDFFIDDEKQIIYSSSSKSMLDEYDEGLLFAISGTVGSIREREEAKTLYGAATPGVSEDMRFINVPRHQDLKRIDNPLRLARNQAGQRALLVEQIREAKQRNQPILVLCENDIESKAMVEYLRTQFADDERIERIDAQYPLSAQARYIDTQAGTPGTITVSTSKIGRGTDIPLHGDARLYGLRVLINYLPREREYRQMIGRSGRFGAKGDSRMILNKVELKKQFNKSTLTDGFYTASESYIQQQQAIMDRKAQVERLIKFTVDGFRHRLTQHYFESLFTQVAAHQHDDLVRLWKTFFEQTDKKWHETLQQINREIDATQPNIDLVQGYLTRYQSVVQIKWSELRATVAAESFNLVKPSIKQNPIDCLEAQVASLVLSDKTRDILGEFNVKTIAPLKTAVYQDYNPSHDGMATVYTAWFVKIRATLRGERRWFADFHAWREGHGILFPNLRALFKGHMTWVQFLFGAFSNSPGSAQPDPAAEPIPSSADNTDDIPAQPAETTFNRGNAFFENTRTTRSRRASQSNLDERRADEPLQLRRRSL